MPIYPERRHLLALLSAAALALPCAGFAQETYPSHPITIIVPTGPGGSLDRISRAMAPFLAEELGQPVTVENHPGGTSILGSQMALQAPSDGYTLLATIPNYIIVQSALGQAPYTIDDFAYINAQWTDFGVLMVPTDRPYQSIGDLVDDIRARPGEISTAGLAFSDNRVNLVLLLDALDIPEDAVRFVAYQGGGELRAAIAGGQVDFVISGAEGSDGVREFVRPLAVFRDEGTETWSAPPVNEYLAQFDTEIPYIVGSIRAFMTSAAFREEHPDRWDTLVAAFMHVMQNEEAVASLTESGIGAEWRGPDATQDLVHETAALMNPIVEAWEQNN